MEFFQIALLLSALLCSLVAGFLGAFAVVVMPGIKNLDNRAFIRSFQVMDGVIQNNQPLFLGVWIGSVLTLLATAILGIQQLAGVELLLLITATLIYLLGVQLPTIMVNVPLNNMLQSLDVDSANEETIKNTRWDFESKWNRWNIIRTTLATLTSALLIAVFIL